MRPPCLTLCSRRTEVHKETGLGNASQREKSEEDPARVLAERNVLRQQLAELADREARRKHVSSYTPLGLCHFDRELRFVEINEWLARINGLSVEEHLGQRIRDVLPQVAEGVVPQLLKVIEAGEPILEGTAYVETPAHPGARHLYEHSYYPHKSEDGTVLGVSCVVRDITEQVRAQAAEIRFREAVEKATDGIVMSGEDGLVSYFNGAAEKMFGYTRDEVLGSPWAALIPEWHRERKEAGVSRFLATEPTEELSRVFTLEGLHKSGTVFPIELGVSSFRIDGQVVLTGIVRDMTERHRADARLRESEERYRGIFEGAVDMIHPVDERYRIVEVNETELHKLGYTRTELIGKPLREIIHPDFLGDDFEAGVARVKSGETIEAFETDLLAKDGTRIPIVANIVPIMVEGKFTGAQAILNDITDRRRAEEALRLLVEGTGSVGDEFFRQLVQSLAAALRVKFAFVSELVDSDGGKLRLLSLWAGTEFGETFEYATKDTPCEEVVGKGSVLYADGVKERFPKDVWLREAGVESYLAIPLFDSVGNPLGHMGVMHDQPMEGGLSRSQYWGFSRHGQVPNWSASERRRRCSFAPLSYSTRIDSSPLDSWLEESPTKSTTRRPSSRRT